VPNGFCLAAEHGAKWFLSNCLTQWQGLMMWAHILLLIVT